MIHKTKPRHVRAAFMTVAACVVSFVASGVDLPEPIVWYDMESLVDGKVADKSGNGRDLTLGAGATLTNSCGGATGNALFFDGTRSAYSSFQSPALGSRTVSFWFRRECGAGPIGSDNTYPYLIYNLSSLKMNLANEANINNETQPWDYCASIFAENSSNASQIRFIHNSDTLGLWREAWSHIAITLDVTSTDPAKAANGSDTTLYHITYKAYVNGVCVSSPATDFAVTNLAIAGTAVLGNWSASGGDRAIFGAIDEFRVWNTALDADQIAAEYERTHAEFETTALLGRWSFDETTNAGNGNLVLTDVAGQAGDITCGAGITITNAGMEGCAVLCNGRTTCYGSASLPIPLRNDFTWTCWVKQSPDSWKNTADKIGEANKGPRLLEFDGNWFGLNLKGGEATDWNLAPRTVVTTPGASGNGQEIVWSRAPQGSWSHLAVVTRYSAGGNGARTAKAGVYFNGVYVGETSDYDTSSKSITTSWIFANNGVNGKRPFEGMLDDLRLYAGALSSNAIVRLYRGAAAVDAGIDFSTAHASAELHGEIGSSAPEGIRAGYAGTPCWSLVSSPAGGEGVVILQPNSPVTQMTLPVNGEYVFRLSNSLEEAGLSRCDEVRVTRIAQAGEAPTVTTAGVASTTVNEPCDLAATATAGSRVRWTKVSGPGGVWFAPENAGATRATFDAAGEYVVRCTAEKDGAASAADVAVTVGSAQSCDLSDGLIRWWPLAPGIYTKDHIVDSNRLAMTQNANGVVTAYFAEGPGGGYAMRPNGFDAYFSLGKNAMAETRSESSVDNSPPAERYRAVSLWVYHDSTDTNTFKNAAIFMNPFQLGLWYNYNCSDGTANGLLLCQQGWGLSNKTVAYMKRPYALPHSFIDRWTHIYALFDRSQGTDFELWIDGVMQTPTSAVNGQRGRISQDGNSSFYVGGIKYVANDVDKDNGYSKHLTTQDVMSRCFPGKIADVRIYNRKLTAREIKKLAADPDVTANRAPAVDAFEKNAVHAEPRTPMAVATAVFDDGELSGEGLTYRWSVVSGDASKVEFGDATARETTFTASKTGVYVLQLAVSDGERTSYSEPLTVEASAGFILTVW